MSKKKWTTALFWTLVVIAVCSRFLLSHKLLPYIFADNVHDDKWMINSAYNLLHGNWLGDYNQYTLIKGVFSPFFVVGCYLIGIDYMSGYTIIYIISCVVFIIACRPLIKNRWVKLLCLIVLLFNPLSFAAQTFQRIYRNGFSQWQILLLFSAYISVYCNRNEGWKKIIGWELLGGFTLWAMINTREDSAWIYVFVAAAFIVTLIAFIIENKNFKAVLVRGVLMCIPFFMLFIGNTVIKTINYTHYGIYALNDRVDGNFSKVMKCMYNIMPDKAEKEKYEAEEYQGYEINIYRSSLEKAYEVSDTLNSIRPQLESSIKQWEYADSYDTNDGQLEKDHLLFALRDAVKNAGYYEDGRTTEEFYGQIYAELKQGFQDGRLEKRGITISSGSVPFSIDMTSAIFKEIGDAIYYVTKWDEIETVIAPAEGVDQNVILFENMTGNMSTNAIEAEISISGWIFSGNDEEDIEIVLCDKKGNIISTINTVQSQDVYEFFKEKGNEYANSKNARFQYTQTVKDINQGVYLDVYSGGNTLSHIQLTEKGAVIYSQADKLFINFDEVKINKVQIASLNDYYINNANGIIDIYKNIGCVICCIAVLVYIITIIFSIKNKAADNFSIILFIGATLLTILLFVAAISFITVSTFWARHYIYLSSAYVLQLMFVCLSIGFGLDKLIEFVYSKVMNKRNEVEENAGFNQEK